MTKGKYVVLWVVLYFLSMLAEAATPLWTFQPLTLTTVSVPANGTAQIQYQVTNQSRKTHTLSMTAIQGIQQVTTSGNCPNPFVLAYQQSCTLTLEAIGNLLPSNSIGGPVVCEAGGTVQCYQPSPANILRISKVQTPSSATISVTGTPLVLRTNGTAEMTITNTSPSAAAINVDANFTNTALAGKVTVLANTCANVAAGASCTLTFKAASSTITPTDFPIQGSNTNTVNATISIDQFAYVADAGQGSVTRCTVLPDGSFASNCVPVQSALSNPGDIAINHAGSFSYVSEGFPTAISRCSIAGNGDLSNCVTSSGTAQNVGAGGVALHPTLDVIYFTGSVSDAVSTCNLTNDSSVLGACTTAIGSDLSSPRGIVVDSTGSYAYITNGGNNTVIKASISSSGALHSFVSTGSLFSVPNGIAITTGGTRAYIVNASPASVTRCDINSTTKDLENCVNAGGSTLSFPQYIAFNADDAYITSPVGVIRCPIDSSGDLNDGLCEVTGDNMIFPRGIQLAPSGS